MVELVETTVRLKQPQLAFPGNLTANEPFAVWKFYAGAWDVDYGNTVVMESGMSGASDLPASGMLHVQVADDGTLDGGTWHLTTDQHGAPTAQISPPAIPMFQQVVQYLEAKPVPSGVNMRRADEARAAVSVCLRWGSYFAVLADPSKPDAPNIDDGQVSQIDDEEMARMNIEISAGLAWWLTLTGSDDRCYWDIVTRALTYLPAGRKTVSALQGGDMLLVATMPEMAAALQRQWPADRLERDMQTAANHGIRVIANTITLHACATARLKTSMPGDTWATG